MNIHAVPCITYFHPDDNETENALDEQARQEYDLMCHDKDTSVLLDAIDAAGSMHAFLKRVMAVMAAPAESKEERQALASLEKSMVDDMRELLKAVAADND